MNPDISQIKKLLYEAKGIAAHQEEISQLRGERFNIFSILNMESKENGTHSAFLGELLDPKGTHGMGAVFLELFVKAIGYNEVAEDKKADIEKGKEEAKKFIAEGASVVLEQYIGKVDIPKKTGGRIDIYLKDKQGQVISIENKIYAGDQNAQIERYCNHKPGKNRVYYLTLWGHSASKESAGELEAGVGYETISYRKEVIDWLEACIKESANQPILRETIRQYIILIQKLTHQLSDKKMENKIQNLIGENYAASKLIAGNIEQAEIKMAKSFLDAVKVRIEETLSPKDGWLVTVTPDLTARWAGLQIKHDDWDDRWTKEDLVITLHGQPKLLNGSSQYCIFAHESAWDRAALKEAFAEGALENFSDNEWTPFFRWINLFEGDEKMQRLFDKTEREKMVGWVARDLIEMAEAAKVPLAGATRIHNS